MIALVQVTHQTGKVDIFEADSAKPDKFAAQEATPYSIITDAIVRTRMWYWASSYGRASEDMDNATAWARGDRGYSPFSSIWESQ